MTADVDPETVAIVDTVEAVAYARGMGETIAVFYTSMIEHGMPEELASSATASYVAMRFGVWVGDEDEDEEAEE